MACFALQKHRPAVFWMRAQNFKIQSQDGGIDIMGRVASVLHGGSGKSFRRSDEGPAEAGD